MRLRKLYSTNGENILWLDSLHLRTSGKTIQEGKNALRIKSQPFHLVARLDFWRRLPCFSKPRRIPWFCV